MYLLFLTALALLAQCTFSDYEPMTTHTTTLSFLSVGQGNAVLISDTQKHILVDAGPDNGKALQHLQAKGVTTLDAVVITHKDRDHFGGLFDLLSSIAIKKIYLPADQQQKFYWDSLVARIDTIPQVTLTRGMTLPEFTTVHTSVLWPEDALSSGNNASTVLYITSTAVSILLMGDLEEAGEERLNAITPGLTSTILQVGHHGSYTASSLSFIAQIRPEYAVIQVGANNTYGHPHASTIAHLNTYTQYDIFRTDIDSTVTVLLYPTSFTISGSYQDERF